MSVTIKVEKRDIFGKNASRRIRREGKLPAVLYGPDTESVSLIVNKKDIFKILKSDTGENTLFKIVFDAEKRDVMIKDYQQDVVDDRVLHVDLIQIAMNKSINVAVPIVLAGEAVGVKAEGGFVDFITREINVECLPQDIPDHIEVDISGLHLHQSVKVEDIPEIKGVKFGADPQTVLALVQAPKAEEVVEEVIEGEEVVPEEEEPEVIKREKAPEEEEKKEE